MSCVKFELLVGTGKAEQPAVNVDYCRYFKDGTPILSEQYAVADLAMTHRQRQQVAGADISLVNLLAISIYRVGGRFIHP